VAAEARPLPVGIFSMPICLPIRRRRLRVAPVVSGQVDTAVQIVPEVEVASRGVV
jgi:hypothetical protein